MNVSILRGPVWGDLEGNQTTLIWVCFEGNSYQSDRVTLPMLMDSPNLLRTSWVVCPSIYWVSSIPTGAGFFVPVLHPQLFL